MQEPKVIMMGHYGIEVVSQSDAVEASSIDGYEIDVATDLKEAIQKYEDNWLVMLPNGEPDETQDEYYYWKYLREGVAIHRDVNGKLKSTQVPKEFL